MINAFDMPARQSLLVEMVARREDLPNAIALNSSLVNGARLVGPALAGAVIAAAGEAWCFVDRRGQLPGRGRRPAGDAAAAAAGVGRDRHRSGGTSSRACATPSGSRRSGRCCCCWRWSASPPCPRRCCCRCSRPTCSAAGPHTLGLLSAAPGLGALAGALYLASRPSVLGLGRVIVVATVVLGLGLAGFSQSGSVWLSAALLVATGAGMMVQMAASNTLIQTMVDEDKRGRVMGFYGMAFQGAAPFGSLLAGWLAGVVGSAPVVLGSGVLVLVGGLAFATQLPRLRRHARPVYARLGILPASADGRRRATALPPALRETG